MKSGESKVFKHGIAQTLYVVIPAKVAIDSQCPVKSGDTVEVLIKGSQIVITPKRLLRYVQPVMVKHDE